ncbi:SDR family oxidoreductase [Paenactinomyces guangxiensis]|uniref:SDR family oxidoreductase n=2 Tax=Paenactinomyces guangxiensis TaxID=1490290 RepID=A0A7W2A8Q1_9BACL|nr:SDR family oxidoreductase [Paenactinomyces guangxiensis]MBA4494855.1 SDR family oxidoreductase [Paenactinomyces guangxiensis]
MEAVLITGAGSGIGYELSRLFAMNGYDLVIVAENGERLEQLATEWRAEFGVRVLVMPKDLAHPSAPEEIVSQLKEKEIEIDLLVNNAEITANEPFTETPLEQELAMIQVNVTALTHLTRLLIGEMAARGKGKVLNVASTVVFRTNPGDRMAVYRATQAYILAFSEALAQEFKEQGITVSALCPRPPQTEPEKKTHFHQHSFFGARLSDREVATAAFRGLMEGKSVIIPGMKNQLFARSVRLLPRNMVKEIMRKMENEK